MLIFLQIEILQAEVTALKALVITSTPSVPNRHLHPQIDQHMVPVPGTGKKEKVSPLSNFVKGHRRSTSHHNFSKDIKPVDIDLSKQSPASSQPQENREVNKISMNIIFLQEFEI